MQDLGTDYQLLLESSESLDEEVTRKLIEQSRRLQKLPGWQIQALLEDTPRPSSDQVAEVKRAFDQVIETKGLQKEWEEFTTENIELLKKLSRWERTTRQMRCVSLLARSLWEEDFDGWLGDLQEARRELIDAGYSWWRVRLITWGRVALLFWSLIQVKYQDLGL